MINFNIPPYTGKELEYMKQAIDAHKICGDGIFTKRCNQWIEEKTGTSKALLTTSCTHATEMAALLCGIGEGDEVIMPSFTFVSTADAFVIRGAKAVFVDIRPDTMNMDETLIEDAITDRTKAIVPVHYAGVSCEMDTIMDIAEKHHLTVIEDAAQGVMSQYKGKALGTIGDYGCYSFHETKNYSMGEGGALLIKNPNDIEKAEIIREKGTDRSKFFRGQVDKYTWVDYGSSVSSSSLPTVTGLGGTGQKFTGWSNVGNVTAPVTAVAQFEEMTNGVDTDNLEWMYLLIDGETYVFFMDDESDYTTSYHSIAHPQNMDQAMAQKFNRIDETLATKLKEISVNEGNDAAGVINTARTIAAWQLYWNYYHNMNDGGTDHFTDPDFWWIYYEGQSSSPNRFKISINPYMPDEYGGGVMEWSDLTRYIDTEGELPVKYMYEDNRNHNPSGSPIFDIDTTGTIEYVGGARVYYAKLSELL